MILDTNAVSTLMAGDKVLGQLIGSQNHHLPIHVIAEYSYGLLSMNRRTRYESVFRELEANSEILFPDRETADWYASIRHELKLRGTPIPENDLWIAAIARQYNLEIVSRDQHFDLVNGVRRLSW